MELRLAGVREFVAGLDPAQREALNLALRSIGERP